MADIVYQLADTVRSAVSMAYAALGVSALNTKKIVELEQRRRNIELQVDRLLSDYEEEKKLYKGKAISAGKWHAKADGLQAELDQVRSQIQNS